MYKYLEIENSNLKTSADSNEPNVFSMVGGCGKITENISVTESINQIIKERQYGNMICCFYNKNDPLIVIGPDWRFFLILKFVMFILFYSIFIYGGNKFGGTYRIVGIIIYIIQFCSYSIAALKNPGIPSSVYEKELIKHPELLSQKYSKCSLCNSVINLHNCDITFHCSDCGVCIENFDHHCQWTSKCIGRGNLIPFYFFVISTIVYILYCIICVFNFV